MQSCIIYWSKEQFLADISSFLCGEGVVIRPCSSKVPSLITFFAFGLLAIMSAEESMENRDLITSCTPYEVEISLQSRHHVNIDSEVGIKELTSSNALNDDLGKDDEIPNPEIAIPAKYILKRWTREASSISSHQ